MCAHATLLRVWDLYFRRELFVDPELKLSGWQRKQAFQEWANKQTTPVTIQVNDRFGARQVVATPTILNSATFAIWRKGALSFLVHYATPRDYAISIREMSDNIHWNKYECKDMFSALFLDPIEECLKSKDTKWDQPLEIPPHPHERGFWVAQHGRGGGGGSGYPRNGMAPGMAPRGSSRGATSWRGWGRRGGGGGGALGYSSTSRSGMAPRGTWRVPPPGTPPGGVPGVSPLSLGLQLYCLGKLEW